MRLALGVVTSVAVFLALAVVAHFAAWLVGGIPLTGGTLVAAVIAYASLRLAVRLLH